jgi:hypothetical protein
MAIWEVGKNYLVRTVTMINTGRLAEVGEHEIVLDDAAWIADPGQFSSSLVTCEFSEVEMFPPGRSVIVGRGAIVDAVQIDTLPTQTK